MICGPLLPPKSMAENKNKFPKHTPQETEKSTSDPVMEVVERLPPEERERYLLRLTRFQGPLPPWEDFEQYDRVLPGTAERIINAFDEERKYRHEISKTVVSIEKEKGVRAQRFAFLIALAAFITGGFCAYIGQLWPASVIGGSGAAMIVASFLGARQLPTDSKASPENEQD